MHSSLPGLTRLEQMFLVALADTVATTSAEVASSTDQQYTGECICLCYLWICTVDYIKYKTSDILANSVFLKQESSLLIFCSISQISLTIFSLTVPYGALILIFKKQNDSNSVFVLNLANMPKYCIAFK